MLTSKDFEVKRLGVAHYSAVEIPALAGLAHTGSFTPDEARIPNSVTFSPSEPLDLSLAFEKAGPRAHLYFDPKHVKAAIVTCGGICPGLNDVIRALFMTLFHTYGVEKIYGIQAGFRGLNPDAGLEPVLLSHEMVLDLASVGGTILGTARGRTEADVMMSTLKKMGVNMLFVVGGDGSQKGAHAIHLAAREIGLELAVVGIPKTIDNDINYVSRTFGFDTAVEIARMALDSAFVEAQGNPNGVGLVKVMGRDSGFIAAHATLASNQVNAALVPEVPFLLEGPQGLLVWLQERLERSDHRRRRAVVVVAEGAGQEYLADSGRQDASGNRLHDDIGQFLKARINSHMKNAGVEINLKYIDPSYMLRAQPTNSSDSIFAADLARAAVHGAMAGCTDMMIGTRYDHFIHVPIPLAVSSRRKIDPAGDLWQRVMTATGQPTFTDS